MCKLAGVRIGFGRGACEGGICVPSVFFCANIRLLILCNINQGQVSSGEEIYSRKPVTTHVESGVRGESCSENTAHDLPEGSDQRPHLSNLSVGSSFHSRIETYFPWNDHLSFLDKAVCMHFTLILDREAVQVHMICTFPLHKELRVITSGLKRATCHPEIGQLLIQLESLIFYIFSQLTGMCH